MGRKPLGEQRRREILAGLFKAMAKQGYHKCNMNDIAREADISRGVLHYYFKNKEEMFNEMVQMLESSNYERFAIILNETTDPVERLRRTLLFPVSDIGEPAGIDLARVWVELWGLSGLFPRVHEFMHSLQVRLCRVWEYIIRDGQTNGLFRTDAPAAVLAVNLLATMEGLVLQWRFDKQRFDFEKQVENCVDVLLTYLRRTP